MCLSLSFNNIHSLLRVKEAFRVLSVRLASAVTLASKVNRDRKVPEEHEAHQLVLILSVCPVSSSPVCHSSAATLTYMLNLCPTDGIVLCSL